LKFEEVAGESDLCESPDGERGSHIILRTLEHSVFDAIEVLIELHGCTFGGVMWVPFITQSQQATQLQKQGQEKQNEHQKQEKQEEQQAVSVSSLIPPICRSFSSKALSASMTADRSSIGAGAIRSARCSISMGSSGARDSI
jgi:hypothetical protein